MERATGLLPSSYCVQTGFAISAAALAEATVHAPSAGIAKTNSSTKARIGFPLHTRGYDLFMDSASGVQIAIIDC